MSHLVRNPRIYVVRDRQLVRLDGGVLPPPGPDPSDPTTRDPLYWPYPPDSIWNMPIGAQAQLVKLGFKYNYQQTGDSPQSVQAARIGIEEENVLVLAPDAPLRPIWEHTAGWTDQIRCDSTTGRLLRGNGSVPEEMMYQPIPAGWSTDNPAYIGSRPNMSGAVVYRDGDDLKVFETQPFHFCTDWRAVSQFVNHTWVGDSILYGGHGAHPDRPQQYNTPWDTPSRPESWGQGGSHGGSYMTAFGGTIRLHEVKQREIPHALKLTWDTGMWCSGAGPHGHRWPALRADGGSGSNYGNLVDRWGFPDPPVGAKMGCLVTTSPGFNPETLETEAGKMIGRAIWRYGAYLVDGNHDAQRPYELQWHVERSNEGIFGDVFQQEFGFRFFHKNGLHGTPSAQQLAFRRDLGKIAEDFHIVNDNSPTNVGGAGPRRWQMAPPITL